MYFQVDLCRKPLAAVDIVPLFGLLFPENGSGGRRGFVGGELVAWKVRLRMEGWLICAILALGTFYLTSSSYHS
jgi:hypothetical protein